MLHKISHKKMGSGHRPGLESLFHFSFADYYNPDNKNFGKLRVVNDDLVGPGVGFEMHPHHDMEIITYVIDGYLSHEDSLGHKGRVGRGQVQYMSAGTGISHSEYNHEDQPLRLLQIWMIPDQKGHPPSYGEFAFDWSERDHRWFHFVSDHQGTAPIKIHQDANFYIIALDSEKETQFAVKEGRQGYLIQIEGSAEINGETLNEQDALEVVEETLTIKANEQAHILMIEMKKE